VPEGDTIHKLAARLAPQLVGKTLERVTTQGLERAVTGKQVAAVEAHGKHLVITLDDGAYIRTHLGMYGRTRSFPRAFGETQLAKLSPGRVTLALVMHDAVHLWLGARTVEIAQRRAPMRGTAITSLGPDLLADNFDSRLAASRAGVHDTRTIADVLLDQRVASGIGNVYKSEVLFVHNVDPRTLVGALSDAELDALYQTARELMLENLGPGPRTTRERLAGDRPGDDRYFVYSRSGKPCRRCGAKIDCYALGDPVVRWTWSCPQCQSLRNPTGVSR
jgi:endonuclease VIII